MVRASVREIMAQALQVDRDMVRTLYMAGVRPTEIARQTGCKAATIGAWATRYGWVKALRGMSQSMQIVQARAISGDNRLRDALRSEAASQVETLTKTPIKNARSLANTPQRQGRAAVLKTLTEAVSLIDDWEQEKRSGLVLCDLLSGEPAAIDLQPVAPVAIQDEAPSPQSPADCGIDTPTSSVPEQQPEPQQPQVNDLPSPLSDAHADNE